MDSFIHPFFHPHIHPSSGHSPSVQNRTLWTRVCHPTRSTRACPTQPGPRRHPAPALSSNTRSLQATQSPDQFTIAACCRFCRFQQNHCCRSSTRFVRFPCVAAFDSRIKLAHSEVSSGSQAGPGSSNKVKDVPSFKNADDAQKSVMVEAEVQRMKRHPMAGSAYATARLEVLNKMLQLLGKDRMSTEGEELELLFANLNF